MSKKIAVIYKSKYGSTKRYAQWIAQETHGDLYERSQVGIQDLLKYDVIVYGGSLHAVGIKGVDLITNHMDELANKKIIVIGTGASPIKEANTRSILENNFEESLRDRIYFFQLRGAFNYKNLSFVDKMMMNMLRFQIKRKKELDEDSKGLLTSFYQPFDFTDKEAILPILQCINE